MARVREIEQITKDIRKVMVRVKAVERPLPSSRQNDYDVMHRYSSGVDCDEVFDNIFIGDVGAALNKNYLLKAGINHVVNSAEGRSLGMVNTGAKYYSGTGIKYMGLHLLDLSVANISVHFHQVADFIENAISKNGKVLVHCYMGVSRSGTLVVAYLMIKLGMSACDAMEIVRQRRNIHPNDGFIRQLAALDHSLSRAL